MKKIILLMVFMISGMCYGQSNFIDTVFYNNGKKKVCKFQKETSSQILFQTRDDTGILDWTVSKEKIQKYIDKTDDGVKEIIISDHKIPTQNQTTATVIKLPTLKDSINFLMNENIMMKQQLSQSAVNFGNLFNGVNLAGKHLKRSATYSWLALSGTVISGFFTVLATSYNVKISNTNNRTRTNSLTDSRNICYAFAGVFGAATLGCTIMIPISIGKSGKILKEIK